MYKVVISDHAKEDLNEILTYISDVLSNPTAASHFADRLEQTLMQLAEHPYSFEQAQDPLLKQREYRKAVIDNYVLLYLVDDETQTTIIARLFFGRRDYAKYI